ncbi:hypothetical protein A3L11_02630 [Thermococcus siculi]|uniref:Uncharacterized protein n=1 Tax=Thermococcus siculi TaxID=72803 RepID=A0A2Z2MK55_9EURY|nr:hypothetical protein [Thermococcus siculi]ASJ08178.1 hypothetical protein A3L11_02630 [Thermococcus siculi]
MKRTIGLFLFFFLIVSIVFLLFLSSPERYLVQLHAEFPKPVEFRGTDFLSSYPNDVTHVAIFRFRESSKGKAVWDINGTFEAPPDYVIIELENGSTLYCRANNREGYFVFHPENCYKSLDGALTRHITLTGCINATYTGYRLERKAILVFEFRASNKTTCVNETVEVKGRLWEVSAEIETDNGTVECPLSRVRDSHLADEVFRIEGHCG